jgi:predicted GNAT family acetyltransferase
LSGGLPLKDKLRETAGTSHGPTELFPDGLIWKGFDMVGNDADVTDNRDEGRYELAIGKETAFAVYERRGGAVVFTHTEVPAKLEGRGLASRLIKAALADARHSGLKVLPLCTFVADYIERHPEEQDLLPLDAPG